MRSEHRSLAVSLYTHGKSVVSVHALTFLMVRLRVRFDKLGPVFRDHELNGAAL